MQDEETGKTKKLNWKDIFWSLAALGLVGMGGLFFWHTFNKIPHAEWRNEYKPFSWKADGVCIDEAEAYWKSSKGDSRMELRAFCYPVCNIKLDEASGNGMITVRFLNDAGVQMGDRIYLLYRDGKLVPDTSNSMQVTETEATVRLEDGFLSKDAYLLHQISQNAPLWRVEVDCTRDNIHFYRLGHLSIIPHEL